jgi:hypothetical protein
MDISGRLWKVADMWLIGYKFWAFQKLSFPANTSRWSQHVS